jgi:hypothetical protein
VEYIVLDRARVIADDNIIDITDGLVTANGDSVRIAEYSDPQPAKAIHVDTLVDATMTDRGGIFTFSGKSVHLMKEVGIPPDEAVISVRVTKYRGCRNCP